MHIKYRSIIFSRFHFLAFFAHLIIHKQLLISHGITSFSFHHRVCDTESVIRKEVPSAYKFGG